MSSHQLVDHLFRSRAGQLVAWLTRIFGPAHLELAEEVVQEALLKALQQWPYTGVPQNPSGWLFRVARNGALDVLRRHAAFGARAHEIQRRARTRDRPATRPRLRRSKTTSCGWCSCAAIRRCRRTRASPSA